MRWAAGTSCTPKSMAQQIPVQGDEGSGEPGCGARVVRSSTLYSLKERCGAAGWPCICCGLPTSTPSLSLPRCRPLVSFPPPATSAPGAGLLQKPLAIRAGRDYFKSSEEESWRAGQGCWVCGHAGAGRESQVSLCPVWIFRGLAGTGGPPPAPIPVPAGQGTRLGFRWQEDPRAPDGCEAEPAF